jgi:hypothetical protein
MVRGEDLKDIVFEADYTASEFIHFDEKGFEELAYLLDDIADRMHSYSLKELKEVFSSEANFNHFVEMYINHNISHYD